MLAKQASDHSGQGRESDSRFATNVTSLKACVAVKDRTSRPGPMEDRGHN
jgi:hypothetical protein